MGLESKWSPNRYRSKCCVFIQDPLQVVDLTSLKRLAAAVRFRPWPPNTFIISLILNRLNPWYPFFSCSPLGRLITSSIYMDVATPRITPAARVPGRHHGQRTHLCLWTCVRDPTAERGFSYCAASEDIRLQSVEPVYHSSPTPQVRRSWG